MLRWDHTSCRRLLGFGVLFPRLWTTVFCLLAEIHDGTDNESPAAQACSGLRLPEPLLHFLRFFFQVDDHIRVLRAVDIVKMHPERNQVNIIFRFWCINGKYFYCT